MKQRKGSKTACWEMTSGELAVETKRFDKPLSPSQLKPLSKDEQARFEKARRAGGKGVTRIHARGN
jgi:hypothetical protein